MAEHLNNNLNGIIFAFRTNHVHIMIKMIRRVKRHNYRYWTDSNRYLTRVIYTQRPRKRNEWDNILIGL